MYEHPAVYFHDLEFARFQEEVMHLMHLIHRMHLTRPMQAVLTCMLMDVAPWDDYIMTRVKNVENDQHPVFASVIGLFFGARYTPHAPH